MTDTPQPLYNPAIHHRRSIRLQGYDYSQAGAYFITICTHKRECLFGDVGAGSQPPFLAANPPPYPPWGYKQKIGQVWNGQVWNLPLPKTSIKWC